ncbi:hypothetical protein GTP41_25070 [Pseudoduganella sp. DS3]|uniref:Restriction endonuclease n=1 Tax=Pseudoduganella guangdongensis TaxID=2692179 RepID=A0A6N9HRA2_9BURK|nr:hypothetical protein [Pseudoduganella guangdongensis]MYN05375.1 hypothetical protein [Pseudoduganella guangdongensis]
MKPLVQCKEWSKLSVGKDAKLRSTEDIVSILRSWQVKTGGDPSGYFDVSANSITPKFWSGTLETSRLRLEVAPMGSDILAPGQRTKLDANLTAMLAFATSSQSVSSGAAFLSANGNRYEALVAVFCHELQLARRRLVLRRYITKRESLNAPRGRIAFPDQCYETIRRPGKVMSEWVALTEDIAENRIFKFVLTLYRPRCSSPLRAKIDGCLAELENVQLSNDVSGEWTGVRTDRLPEFYGALLDLSKTLLNEEGSGVLAGETLALGEILFTSRLFERYVMKEVSRISSSQGLSARPQSRGTFLCRDENARDIFELIPDMRLVDSHGKTKMILDAKWKELDHANRNRGIKREDIYQLLVYGGKYECRDLLLVYPDISLKTGAIGHYEKFSVDFGGGAYNIGVVRVPMLAQSLTLTSDFLRHVLGREQQPNLSLT